MLGKKKLLATVGATLVLASTFHTSPTYAQALEEIVVTARKREENLMTTPLAITVFSAKDIESANLKDLSDISARTPGFFFQTQVGGGSGRADRSFQVLTFRGLSLASSTGVSAGGLLFIDGAPVIGASIAGLEGIERVEVLKGPQSAYFGRSTFSGALSLTTKDPSLSDFKAKISAEVGSYGSNKSSLSLEGPLVKDVLAVRLTGYRDFEGGQYKNFADQGQTLGDRKTESVSGSAVLKPSDSLKLKAYVNYFENNDGPPAQGAIKGVELNCNLGGTLGRYYCGTVPDKLDARNISGNYTLNSFSAPRLIDNINNNYYVVGKSYLQHPGLTRKALQGTLKADYETEGGYSLSSTTAYHRDKYGNLIDLSFRDGRNLPNPFNPTGANPASPSFVWWYLTVQSAFDDVSQEVRITSPQEQRFRWTVGGNYLAASSEVAVNGFSVFGNLASSGVTHVNAKTPAVFGGTYFDIAEDLTLSAEGRYQWDKVRSQAITSGGGVPLGGTGPVFQNTYRSFSPRVTLDYKFMENSTLYLLWSRGYRPGGFNTALATLPAAVFTQYFAPVGAKIAYDQEQLDNFEAGIKTTFLDNRARATLAVYNEKYKNGQVSATVLYFVPGNPNVQLAAPIQNIGRVDLKGVELESELQATENLNLSGTFALNDSKIKAFFCADCLQIKGNTNAVGNRMSISPKWNWSLAAEYSDRLTSTFDWYSRLDYTHRGSYFAEFANVAKNSAADNVNLRIGVRNEAVSLEAYATNLTQNFSPQIAQGTDLFNVGATSEIRYGLSNKRRLGLRGTYNF